MATGEKITPLMQQYFEIKQQFQETLLFFQVGDFFELFFDDAIQAAAFLNITLTKRGTYQDKPIPLCGVPSQSLDIYLAKLVKGGFRVAICEQLELATPGKVVKRGITRVLTPGTLIDSNLLDDQAASYFCTVFPLASDWAILFGELLTMQLFATVLPAQGYKILESELARFLPDEILLPTNKDGKQLQSFLKSLGYVTTLQASTDQIDENLFLTKFNASVLSKVKQIPAIHGALNNFYNYLEQCQPKALGQFQTINFYEPENFLILDAATQHHLELVRNNYDGSRKHSLLDLIDQSATAMGARMLRKWLMRPLVDLAAIKKRQQAIKILVQNLLVREKLGINLRQVADFERVIGRIALDRGSLPDYLQLKQVLNLVPAIKQLLVSLTGSELIDLIAQNLNEFSDLAILLEQSLNIDHNKDWLIRDGFNLELDQIRELVQDASIKFIELEQREQNLTGINSLKVRFNQIQGYYIEITKANLAQVPAHYIRQQTLVGKERFITIELQQLQANLAQARQNIDEIEQKIFSEVKQQVNLQLPLLRKLAASLAQLDALNGLASLAYAQGYVLPLFNNEQRIHIVQGRHPVVEQLLAGRFVPNDTDLSAQSSLWIITGPNMGGKSTYLRQVAIICILAQIGSFVPAQSADLPVLDRIFTRIGASDNLTRGKSTFLVEMEETASICRQATKHSLVILDEVGRGTSTFDGLAIAQAVIEYIYTQIGANCLFATHYHELTTLNQQFSGIANYYAASKATQNGIVLLHKILPGVANGSFGVQAARCADLPSWIVARAETLLKELSVDQVVKDQNQLSEPVKQVDLVQKVDFTKQIMQLDLDNMSPRQVVDFLYKLQQELL